MLGSADSEHPELTNGEIICKDFQPVWSRYLNVTDGQTDDLSWQYHALRIIAW